MKKEIFKYAFIGIIACLLCFLIYNNFDSKKEKYELVTVVTYYKFTTLMNDGGTHYDRKYILDFKEKKLKKYEDYYVGFEGLKYKDKLLYEKKLDNKSIEEFNYLLEDIINNKDKYENDYEKTYIYYTISSDKFEEIKIYDKTIIQKIEDIFSK